MTRSDGLTRLNFVRSLANLAPVAEDTTDPNFDPGCQLHAEWIVTNNVLSDDETPGTPGFSAAGQEAAVQSNSESSTSATLTLTQSIDGLMNAPFHGVGFIDPLLTTTGFGLYSNPNLSPTVIRSGAAINVLGGRNGAFPAASAYPILWPANGQTTPYASYSGNEYPDPSSSLSFLPQPAAGIGPGQLSSPLIIQFASTPSVSAFSLSLNGNGPLVVAEFDETNYTNPDAATQTAGRGILEARHAAVLMASTTLTAGGAYTASITNAGVVTTWSFNVSDTAERAVNEGTNSFH